MVLVKIKTPVLAEVEGSALELQDLEKELTYTNSSISYQLSKLLKNKWLRANNPKGWSAQVDDLKSKSKRTLMWHQDGKTCIYPGYLSYIKSVSLDITNEICYPPFVPVKWKTPLPFELYPYQKESVDKMIEAKHAAISITTGGGKSAIALTLCHRIGEGVVVVVPFASLFGDMLENLEKHFGKTNVGGYGDGHKKIGKKFTVAIAKSLSNLKPGTEEWEFFSNAKALIADECHLWAATTLEDVAHGLFKNVPYRFSLTGTVTRGDGAIKLLKSITGPVVKTLKTKEAIQSGFICDHEFKIKTLQSTKPSHKVTDPQKMKRFHLLYNKNVVEFIAKLCNAVGTIKGESVLVLVEELEQISKLIPLLTVPYAYAHSSSDKTELSKLGLEKVDSLESIEKFNKGEVRVIIGTSCISTGCNLFPTHHTVNWVGGSSEIKTLQGSVGRSVRKLEYSKYKDLHVPKPKATIWDFDIDGISMMENHLESRIDYYKYSGTTISWLDKKNKNE